jgi:hypothetical protein
MIWLYTLLLVLFAEDEQEHVSTSLYGSRSSLFMREGRMRRINSSVAGFQIRRLAGRLNGV